MPTLHSAWVFRAKLVGARHPGRPPAEPKIQCLVPQALVTDCESASRLGDVNKEQEPPAQIPRSQSVKTKCQSSESGSEQQRDRSP